MPVLLRPTDSLQWPTTRIKSTMRFFALLCLTMHEDGAGTRAWKGHDWAAMDRLYETRVTSEAPGD